MPTRAKDEKAHDTVSVISLQRPEQGMTEGANGDQAADCNTKSPFSLLGKLFIPPVPQMCDVIKYYINQQT